MLRYPQLTLSENQEVALCHFKSLERRFKCDPGFALSYAKVVKMNTFI